LRWFWFLAEVVPFFVILQSRALEVVAAVALLMASVAMAASIWFFPYVNHYKSPGPFSMQVKSTVPATSPLYIYADRMDDFNFYTERQKLQCCFGLANWRKCANKPVPPIYR
jgi:hypothetical protein